MNPSIGIGDLRKVENDIAAIAMKKSVRGAKAAVARFGDRMVAHVKDGYRDSRQYGINTVSQQWWKERTSQGSSSPDARALYWKGYLYKSIIRTPVVAKRLSRGEMRYSFVVKPKNLRHPHGGKSTQWLAAYHEKSRPLWESVRERHFDNERDKLMAELAGLSNR